MLFVIDIGNTHTVLGIFNNDRIVNQWRIRTEGGMTSDELVIAFNNLFSIHNITAAHISGVIISSVVPQLESAYYACFSTLFPALEPHSIINVCNNTVANLIDIRIDNPAEIGADRLVNGISAFSMFGGSTVVIDFGTAITFDCISSNCEYLGGLILPGLNIALEALTAKAAKLPQIDIVTPPEKVIGTCTISAMKSGVMNGYGSMIEGLVKKVKNEMSNEKDISIVATGGMATVIKPYSPSIQYVEPNLTLNGLVHIFHKLHYHDDEPDSSAG